MSTRTLVEELPREVSAPLAISMDGTKRAFASGKSRYERELQLVDAHKRGDAAVLAKRKERSPLARLVFSRDGSLLIGSGGTNVLVLKAMLGPVEVWTETEDASIDAGPAHEIAPFPMTPRTLLDDWDSMLGRFPCGSGWVGDRFALHEGRLQVFVPATGAAPYDRYWIVWQLIGEHEDKVESSIVAVGESPIWAAQKMASHGSIRLRRAGDEPTDGATDFAVELGFEEAWDEEALERRAVDPETHTFARQPKKDADFERRRIASDALRHRMWLDEPLDLESLAISAPSGGWKCVYREDGDEIVAHVTGRVPPSALERWQNIAAMLCGEKSPEAIAPKLNAPPPPPPQPSPPSPSATR